MNKSRKTPMSTAAPEVTASPASLDLSEDRQDDLSMRSDSSSLWNMVVTPVSFLDLSDLSLESDPDAWTLDSMILEALQRDADEVEENPDCGPGLRFRHRSSPKAEVTSPSETEERPSVGFLLNARKLPSAILPASEVILVKEADEDSRVDLTEASLTPLRPRHSKRRQGNPLSLPRLPAIADSECDTGCSASAFSVLVAYHSWPVLTN